jgi:hypothetical protein
MSNLLNPFRVDEIGVIPQGWAAKNAAQPWALPCNAFGVVASLRSALVECDKKSLGAKNVTAK